MVMPRRGGCNAGGKTQGMGNLERVASALERHTKVQLGACIFKILPFATLMFVAACPSRVRSPHLHGMEVATPTKPHGQILTCPSAPFPECAQ